MRVAFGVLLIALLSSCATQGPTAASARDEVAAATAAWAAAFNSNEPARIVALYDTDAVLWGTSSKKVATTPAAVADYFKDLPKTPNLRVVVGDQHIRILGEVAMNTGYYTFTFPKGELPARFTFVFRHREGKWWIVEHHSSRVP